MRRAAGKAIGEVSSSTDAVLRVRVAGTPVDIVSDPYPPLELVPGPDGFALASIRDLAAMMLAAIAKRGLRRDFWDLHAILDSGLALRDAGRAYVERFGVNESDLHHVARALTWFADAEAENVWPPGLTPARWRRIKSFFEKEAGMTRRCRGTRGRVRLGMRCDMARRLVSSRLLSRYS